MPGIVREKERNRDQEQAAIDALILQMAKDVNASRIAISEVVAEVRAMDDAISVAEDALQDRENALEVARVAGEAALEAYEEVEAENETLAKTDAEAQAKLDQLRADLVPLVRKAEELASQRKALETELAEARKAADSLQSRFDSLAGIRNTIVEGFAKHREFYRESIKPPAWIYYGDKLNVTVANVRPSGAGAFLPLGVRDGLRTGMEFLVRRNDPNASGRRSRRVRATLVQDNFSFVEEMSGFGEPGRFLKQGETIELERSGETVGIKKKEEEPAAEGKDVDAQPAVTEASEDSFHSDPPPVDAPPEQPQPEEALPTVPLPLPEVSPLPASGGLPPADGLPPLDSLPPAGDALPPLPTGSDSLPPLPLP